MMPRRPQAARLSKDAAFLKDVRIVPVLCAGNRPTAATADAAWDDFFDAPGINIERSQPLAQEREFRWVDGLRCED